MRLIDVTLDTSHSNGTLVRLLADSNMLDMSFTLDVSHTISGSVSKRSDSKELPNDAVL